MKNVAIVGLGLIGGSLALALSKRGFVVRAGDSDPEQVARATAAGLDASVDLRDSLRRGAPDALVICTPISSIAPVYRMYSADLGAGVAQTASRTYYFHAGSLLRYERLGLLETEAGNLLGTHPLAGDSSTGFEAARVDLFQDCTVVVEQRATLEQAKTAADIWTAAGASRIIAEDANAHDARMPVVSHLPQLASMLLALTIAQQGQSASDLGTGGRDATRLAQSPFQMWKEILQLSRDELLPLLAQLQLNTGAVSDALHKQDWKALEVMWREGARLHEHSSITKGSRRES